MQHLRRVAQKARLTHNVSLFERVTFIAVELLALAPMYESHRGPVSLGQSLPEIIQQPADGVLRVLIGAR